MNYEDELRAKLEAVHINDSSSENGSKMDSSKVDELIVQELHDEFDFSQYDLHESDLLRAIKIESIISQYPDIFKHLYALKLFYSIAKATSLNVNSLYKLIKISKDDFLHIIKEMRYHELIDTNEHNEVELTQKGKVFAKSIGVDIYI